jgi:tetratricopeptide (TPR) repeat protein
MSIVKKVARLAVQQVAVKALGFGPLDRLVGEIGKHFTEHGQKLTKALATAHARSWTALEIALGGPGWWQQCVAAMMAGDEKALAARIKTFLDTCPLPVPAADRQAFRQKCLEEMHAARAAGLLKSGSFRAGELEATDELFRRCADPRTRLQAEEQAVADVADELRRAGYPNLAELVTARQDGGQPLFVAAVRYFFRQAVQADSELSHALAFAQAENLAGAQQSGFDALADALDSHGERVEQLLGSVAGVVARTHDLVLDLRAELEGQRDEVRRLGDAVLAVLQQHQLQRGELRPGDSLAIQDDGERRLVKRLQEHYRGLPPERRQHLPNLLNGLGRLEMATGDFPSAVSDFQTAARLAAGPAARAEAHYHAYRAALECGNWGEALEQLREAARLDPVAFEPFPFEGYAPQRILGASGLGTTFLCRAVGPSQPVVVKALHAELLDPAGDRVLAEAQVVRQLGHPVLTPVLAGGYADPARRARLFLVTKWFDAPSLSEHVRAHGPLTPAQTAEVGWHLAEALLAAHRQHVVHRGVKPSNVLLRKDGDDFQVRLVDCGLALRGREEAGPGAEKIETAHSLFGDTLHGRRLYAAPEQNGRGFAAEVGPAADVYGFGRTCCFALFGTARPLPKHWLGLPQPWKRLLQLCLQEEASNRLSDCGEVLRLLEGLAAGPAPAASPAPAGIGTSWWRRLWPRGARRQAGRGDGVSGV